MLNKRGLSAVIATVLLILITIVIGSMIAGFVVPFVKNSLSGTECVNYRDYFKFEEEFEYNCYDGGGLHGVSIKVIDNSSSEKIKGFDLRFIDDGLAKKVSVRRGQAGSCLTDGIKILGDNCGDPLEVPGFGSYSTITYIFNSGAGNFKKVEIYGVIDNDDVCELSDKINLVPCGPNENLAP